MAVKIRLSCGMEDRESKEYGPFDYAELTYDTLRVNDGCIIAYFGAKAGKWVLNYAFDRCKPATLVHVKIDSDDEKQWWSDIVIFSS